MTTFLWCLIGWTVGWVVFGRVRAAAPLDPTRSTTRPEAMTIVVPARNEEATLPLLLGDLALHRPGDSRVVVVDDGSADATAEVASAFPFVELLRIDGPPPGWMGKPWACQIGAEQADTPLLCFLDADVRLGPGALERMAAEVGRRGGLVSVQPWHATERAYEQASALFNVISVIGVRMGTSLTGRPRRPVGAFGPALMTTRDDYERVGGHAAVATEIVEDLALAAAYRDHDREVTVLAGRGLVSYRMYPTGLRSLLEGWTKNFALGAGTTPVPVLAAVVLWLTAMGTAVGYGLDALAGEVGWWGPLVVWGAFSAQLHAMFRQVGSFGWTTAQAFPVLLGVFFLVFFRSLWLTLVRRQVRWRGRTLAVGAAR